MPQGRGLREDRHGAFPIRARLRCPLCQEAQDDPGLDATVACRKCGLYMHLSGECVFVWRRRAKFGGAARVATVSVALAVSASFYFAVRFAPDCNRSMVTGTVALNGKDQSRLAWRMQP